MKTTIKTSALTNPSTPSIHLPVPASTFGEGFRRFLASFPEDEVPEVTTRPLRQPLHHLEAAPVIDQVGTELPMPSLSKVQESLSRSLGDALFFAARPTQRSSSLAVAVNALRAS
jgi:hypothetical protein